MQPAKQEFILGEFRRTLDDRFRLSVPSELVEPLTTAGTDCVLAKERPGSLSLWSQQAWGDRLSTAVDLVKTKYNTGRLTDRLGDVQRFGRLLSTRHRDVAVQARGRILIPEGFREFLGVEPGEDLLVIGAAVCVEIWHPAHWIEFLNDRMPEFGKLMEDLAG